MNVIDLTPLRRSKEFMCVGMRDAVLPPHNQYRLSNMRRNRRDVFALDQIFE